MKKILFVSMSILAAFSFLRAADQPAVEPKTKLAADEPAIELKNKSAFNVENGSRNPFWPIGFKPTARVAHGGADHAGGDVPPSAFLVTTITVDPGARFAIINGKAMMEGQQCIEARPADRFEIEIAAIALGPDETSWPVDVSTDPVPAS